MRRILHRHVEVGISPLEIFFFCEKLNRAVKVSETIGRKVELGVQIAAREIVLPLNLDLNTLDLHFQSLERFYAIRFAPLYV